MNIEDFLNGASPTEVGRVLRRSMWSVRGMVLEGMPNLVQYAKTHYDGHTPDVFTDMDLAAQAVLDQRLSEQLPWWGVKGEEQGLLRACASEWAPYDPYITLDPIDGTKALIRGDQARVAVMLALVLNGCVVCAFVCNIGTGEIIGYDPGYDTPVKSWLLTGDTINLSERPRPKLSETAVVLRGWREEYHPLVQHISAPPQSSGLFKALEVATGSIGVSMSLLWKGIAGAHVIKASVRDTPWDTTPLIGISERLGMVTLRVNEAGSQFAQVWPVSPQTIYPQPTDTVVLHHTGLDELRSWGLLAE